MDLNRERIRLHMNTEPQGQQAFRQERQEITRWERVVRRVLYLKELLNLQPMSLHMDLIAALPHQENFLKVQGRYQTDLAWIEIRATAKFVMSRNIKPTKDTKGQVIPLVNPAQAKGQQ
jgi:hypothetical protein